MSISDRRVSTVGVAICVFAWLMSVRNVEAASGNCWVVAIAMCQDEKHSEDWNQYGEEFALLFQKHAKPMYQRVAVRTVLGREARLSNIVAAFRWVAMNARKGDFVAVYLGAHGGTSKKDGWGAETMDHQSVYGRDLKGLAAQLPCPVLFVIDTCGSGGFARDHDRDIPLPPNCVAICSSRAMQSTTNVLNIALQEALWGQADADGDEFVTVGETIRYVNLRTRKIAPPTGEKKENQVPVMVVGEQVANDLRLVPTTKELVAVLHGGEWHLARIQGESGEQYRLHVMGHQDNPDRGFFQFNEAPKSRVFPLDGKERPVMVEVDGKSRAAMLIDVEKRKATVRYVQGKRSKKSNETVDRDQIRSPFPLPRESE